MRRRDLLALAALVPFRGWAQTLPPPAHGVPGLVRIAGTPAAAGVVSDWSAAFEAAHPGTRVRASLAGSDVAMAALYTARCDVALLGRDATSPELQAFQWIYRVPSRSVPLLRGSVGTPGMSPAVAIMVRAENPLTEISLGALRAVFGDEGSTVRTWGGLGLSGQWQDRPINLYAPEAESGSGRFFRARVLGNSNRMAWARMREFPVPPHPESAEAHAAEAMWAALADDPLGMAVGVANPDRPGIRTVALRVGSGPSVLPDAETIASGAYPLGRTVRGYFAALPHAETLAFLRFVLSPSGQSIAAGRRGYLPLPPHDASQAFASLV